MDLLGDNDNCNNDAAESLTLTINKRYAESYDKWRKKEERQKCKIIKYVNMNRECAFSWNCKFT